MAGVIGSTIMQILKIPTPSDLKGIVSSVSRKDKMALTKVILEERNILYTNDAFPNIESPKKKEVEESSNNEVKKIDEVVEKKEVLTNDEEIIERPIKPQEVKDGVGISSTDFLINEKEKFQVSRKMIKEKEVMGLYDQSVKSNDGANKGSGTLVNSKNQKE